VIIGVLVAVSIPIFTSQLKKARLATNQANARSAKAAAVTQYLSATDADKAKGFIATYTVKTGEATYADATTALTGGLTTEPVEWTVTDKADGTNELGNKVFDSWQVQVDKDGKTVMYKGA